MQFRQYTCQFVFSTFTGTGGGADDVRLPHPCLDRVDENEFVNGNMLSSSVRFPARTQTIAVLLTLPTTKRRQAT